MSDEDAAKTSRRDLIKKTAVGGAALWVAPTVLALDAKPAAASTCECSATTAVQLLTQVTATPATPAECTVPANNTVTIPNFCRFDSTAPVYLWGTGTLATGTNGPLLDDMGVITVTDNLSTVRTGNIYRFQNFCRVGGATTPGELVFSNTTQRVYTTPTPSFIWDFLPPAVGDTSTGATETNTPASWWTASQPSGGPTGTTSTGNPGYTATAPLWSAPIDISLLFGDRCGVFNVVFENRNRYQEYKWSNIWIGSTPP